ncbi:MAG: FHA domain-containing protein [Candidatus Promineifilaceae bacterium]
MEDTARLLIRIGGKPETRYKFDQEITIVGREAINDLMLNDPEVSRRHCRFILDQNGYLIEDLGSTNGTFVNGQRVTAPITLYNGDTVELGKTVRLTFYGGTESQQTQPYVRPNPELHEGTHTNHPPFDPAPAIAKDPFRERAGSQESVEPLPVREPVGDNSAEYYDQPTDPPIYEEAEPADEGVSGFQRYLLGCGCLLLILLLFVAMTFFILDRVASDFLYCGPIRSLWEAFVSLAGHSLGC